MSDQRPVFLPRADFQKLLVALGESGRRCIGPVERDGTLVFDTLTHVDQLPTGVHDVQAPGSYRLGRDDSPRCFAWANGPQALKPLTFAPVETLWEVAKDEQGLHFRPAAAPVEKIAVIGARGCDLAALALQEQHFQDPTAVDPMFSARRAALLIVAVDCTHPADTCFCASTGDGPTAQQGYDIAMSELDQGFLLRSATPAGREILDSLSLPEASETQVAEADLQQKQAAARQSRKMPPGDLRDSVFARQDSPHWDEVAERCLACGNCTAVCPSCFCSSYEAQPSLDGNESGQKRLWDSCFNFGHSNLHGHAVRDNIGLRYRQWLTHKVAGWYDQYGRSGCTGCGRCITWCPVGIDLTEELSHLLDGEAS